MKELKLNEIFKKEKKRAISIQLYLKDSEVNKLKNLAKEHTKGKLASFVKGILGEILKN